MSMSITRWAVLGGALMLTLHAQSALAATVTRVVGTCGTVSAANRHATIQSAVNASIASAKPTNILVCPGTYPEQVVIAGTPDYEPVIVLKSYSTTIAKIVAPPGGLEAKYLSANYGWVAPQIFVRDTTGVSIMNLEVDGRRDDGTFAACAIGQDGNPATVAGIGFLNAGTADWSFVEAGTIKKVSIHDEPDFATCGGDSNGVISDHSFIKIDDNTIKNVYTNGIAVFAGNAEILRNNISFIGQNGIRITAAWPYDVSRNSITWVHSNGILIEQGSNSITVDSNTFAPALPTGIKLDHSHDNLVINNMVDGEDHVNHTWGGVDGGIFMLTSPNNVVEGNTIRHCSTACIIDEYNPAGGNRIDWNDLYESQSYGVWLYQADGDLAGLYSNLDGGGDLPIQTCISSSSDFEHFVPANCASLSGDEGYFLP